MALQCGGWPALSRRDGDDRPATHPAGAVDGRRAEDQACFVGRAFLEDGALRQAECIRLLQATLPRLGLHWPAFRKVRGQLCKRIRRRMGELGLGSFDAYRKRLEAEPEEWRVLDGLCHVTISRFGRDHPVFDSLTRHGLPDAAQRAHEEARPVRVWSAGCASGEEAYTIRILWDLFVQQDWPHVGLDIVATDVDERILERARTACYPRSSLRELSPDIIHRAFDSTGGEYCVKPAHRHDIDFACQDLRREIPRGTFDLISCRNVAFTYFAGPLQLETLERLVSALRPSGHLVIGARETLPEHDHRLIPICAEGDSSGIPKAGEF